MSHNLGYPLFPANCKSLLSKHLSQEVFVALKDKRTANNVSLNDIISSGLLNPDSGIGVYAGDAESYTVFSELFGPIIADYHGFSKYERHKSNLNADDLHASNPDPNGRYILSTRIRVARNLAAYPLGAAVTFFQRKEIESTICKALLKLNGDLTGQYYSLENMDDETQNQLINDHFLFKSGDRFLEAAGLNRDWPSGRGIFHNFSKTLLVWVNEEDHLRIISMQKGGDFVQVFAKLSSSLLVLQESLEFAYSEHLGYISSCPSNLGTAMRASVHIKLPNLARNMDTFKSITDKYHLQIRGIHGEHSETVDSIFDISNKRRLGITEVQCVQDLHDGVVALIEKEKNFEKQTGYEI